VDDVAQVVSDESAAKVEDIEGFCDDRIEDARADLMLIRDDCLRDIHDEAPVILEKCFEDGKANLELEIMEATDDATDKFCKNIEHISRSEQKYYRTLIQLSKHEAQSTQRRRKSM
jgi:hypothetical protein